MEVRVQVEVKTLLRDIDRKKAGLDATLMRVMEETMQRVYAESQELVPVDTGALRDSARIIKTGGSIAGGLPEVLVVYGGGSVDYAVIVHEDLEAHHASPTQAKFLEIPLIRNESFLASRLRQQIQVLLNS